MSNSSATLSNLPPELLQHIFSLVPVQSLIGLPPSHQFLLYYQQILYKNIYLRFVEDYQDVDSTIRRSEYVARFITSFDFNMRAEYDGGWRVPEDDEALCEMILLMRNLKWLGLVGSPANNIIRLLVEQAPSESLPFLTTINIAPSHFTSYMLQKLLFLLSNVKSVASLSLDLVEGMGKHCSGWEASEKRTILGLDLLHVTALNLRGELDDNLFQLLLPSFTHVAVLEVITLKKLDISTLSLYSNLKVLKHLEGDRRGTTLENAHTLSSFSKLEVLSVSKALFELLDYSIPFPSLTTLEVGIDVWYDEDALHRILQLMDSSTRFDQFTTLNINIRKHAFITHPAGTRWKGDHLEDWELALWDWDESIFLEEIEEIFEIAKKNGIAIGGQIMEVDWPDPVVPYPNDSKTDIFLQLFRAVNVIEKFGLVPQSVFPESFSSSATGRLNILLSAKLREYALELRRLHASAMKSLNEVEGKCFAEKKALASKSARGRKEEQMEEIYRILATTLGSPPKPDESFTYEYTTLVGKKFKSVTHTPLSFYQSFCPIDVSQSISLINDPRNTMDTLYTVQRLGNVVGGRPILYVNTEIDTLKNVAIDLLQRNIPVWFGCDVGKDSSSALGLMETKLYDLEGAFGTTPRMNKEERLRTGDSSMTHAMTLTAVHLDANGRPVRWRVENSWGALACTKGYMLMSDDWFTEHVFQIVADRSRVPANLVKIFDSSKPVQLPPWDSMGSLA